MALIEIEPLVRGGSTPFATDAVAANSAWHVPAPTTRTRERARSSATLQLDAGGTIRWACDTACAVLGGAAETLQGLPVARLLPEVPLRPGTPGYNVAYATLQGRSAPRLMTAIGLDGGPLPLFVSLEPARAAGDRTIVVSLRPPAPAPDQDLQRFLASIVERPEAMAVADPLGRLESINVACEALSGWSHADAAGRHVFVLTGGNRDDSHFERLREDLDAGRTVRATLAAARRDGTPWHVEESARPFVDAAGRVTHYVFTLQDVTARIVDTERLNHIAHHDALTGLPNRVLFAERLDHEFRHGLRRGLGFTLVCLDLDGFKAVNDTHGHAAGDAALRALASSLRQSVREQDTVARLGGDEFAVLLVGTTRREDVAALLASLRAAWRTVAGQLAAPAGTLSIGAARFPVDAASTDELLHKADMAMYRAKRGGGDRACFFDEAVG